MSKLIQFGPLVRRIPPAPKELGFKQRRFATPGCLCSHHRNSPGRIMVILSVAHLLPPPPPSPCPGQRGGPATTHAAPRDSGPNGAAPGALLRPAPPRRAGREPGRRRGSPHCLAIAAEHLQTAMELGGNVWDLLSCATFVAEPCGHVMGGGAYLCVVVQPRPHQASAKPQRFSLLNVISNFFS